MISLEAFCARVLVGEAKNRLDQLWLMRRQAARFISRVF